MTAQHYFYHSFPRRGHGKPEAVDRGLAVLESILDRGLLLTPEIITIKEQLSNGSSSEPWNMLQKRVSFTDLAPSELLEHAKSFGPFALEWDTQKLVQMGAIPVFYVPTRATPNTLDGLGNTLLARLGEIQRLLQRLEQLTVRVNQPYWARENLAYRKGGVDINTFGCPLTAVAVLLQHLSEDIQPLPVLLSSVRALNGYFYPTENLSYGGPLAYYRQREWRILANISAAGEKVTDEATDEDVAALMNLDAEFFGKELELLSGRWQVARKCQFYRRFMQQPLIATVRRIIAPESAISSVRSLLQEKGADVEVVGLEEYSTG
jgi:hypothetical protein